VSAASDSNEEAILTSEVDYRENVGHIGTTRDQSGMFIDHSVVDFPCRIVALIAWLKEFSTETGFE
jgi:hypothetical protein